LTGGPRFGRVTANQKMNATILIVDDESLIRDLVRMTLEAESYRVDEAPDLATLRAKLQSGSATDLVILDLSLPDGNGLSLLPEIKARWPRCKTIILTGYGTIEAAEQAYKIDDVFFQAKPFDVDTLKAMVSLALFPLMHVPSGTSPLAQAAKLPLPPAYLAGIHANGHRPNPPI
jgi:two-component system response regulator PilR (NtrC family)